jgi:hypothetical protein
MKPKSVCLSASKRIKAAHPIRTGSPREKERGMAVPAVSRLTLSVPLGPLEPF